MGPENLESSWKINWLRPRLFWNKQAILPPEIGGGLCRVMTSPANLLEDAHYLKIVPNEFVVELSPKNYNHHFKPLREGLIQQWRDRLFEHLLTSNSRLGRKEYRFGGQLQIELRSAPDLKDSQARILCRVESNQGPASRIAPPSPKDRKKEVAFLEMIAGDRRWPLYPGVTLIGRDESCEIYLDAPLIQEKRLISGQHARIHIENGKCLLFDGGSSSKPSMNGTFVNLQPVPAHGATLRDGDLIIMAAVDPHSPRWDTPGVAAFRFRMGPLGNKPDWDRSLNELT